MHAAHGGEQSFNLAISETCRLSSADGNGSVDLNFALGDDADLHVQTKRRGMLLAEAASSGEEKVIDAVVSAIQVMSLKLSQWILGTDSHKLCYRCPACPQATLCPVYICVDIDPIIDPHMMQCRSRGIFDQVRASLYGTKHESGDEQVHTCERVTESSASFSQFVSASRKPLYGGLNTFPSSLWSLASTDRHT